MRNIGFLFLDRLKKKKILKFSVLLFLYLFLQNTRAEEELKTFNINAIFVTILLATEILFEKYKHRETFRYFQTNVKASTILNFAFQGLLLQSNISYTDVLINQSAVCNQFIDTWQFQQ